MIKLKLRSLVIAALCSLSVGAAVAAAQDASDPLAALPTSDVVAFANVQKILVEVAPRLFIKDPATLLKMTTALNDVYAKSGINLLSIDRVAAGLQFVGPATHAMKKENLGIVIIVHGDFDVDKFMALVRKETNNEGVEESYAGKTILAEPLPAPPRTKTDRQRAALSILDDHTIILGDLPQVRAAIDAATGKGRVDPSLVQLATRDPSSLIGMAGNVPPELIKDLQTSAPQGDQTAQAVGKLLTGLKQVFLTFGATSAEFDMTTGARFESEGQAQSISDLLLGLRQQAVANIDEKEIRDLINAVQVSAQGDELQIKASVPTPEVQNFVASMFKEEKPKVEPNKPEPVTAVATPPKATATTTKTTKHRRTKRRKGKTVSSKQ